MKSTSRLYTSTIVAALGGLLFGFDAAVISGTTAALQEFFSLSEAMLGFTVVTALISTVLGSIAVSRPADIWGRKRVLIVLAVLYTISAIGSGLAWNLYAFWAFRIIGGLALVGLKFLRMEDGGQVSNDVMWLFVGYLFFFGPSTGAVIWVYISEIFPNRVRAKGQSLGSSTHWFMAAVVSQSFPIAAAAKSIGPGNSFLFFAVCMIAQAIFVWKVLPETKGVSLEALQKKLDID